MRPATAGILWVLGGTFLFSLVFASGRLGDGTIPALQIVFIRYVSGFAIVSQICCVTPEQESNVMATMHCIT